MSGTYYLETGGDAVIYAHRLKGDLASLRAMLDNYTRPAADADPLEALIVRATRQLDAISLRFDTLGPSAGAAESKVSDQEAAALDAARDLRTRMMDSLVLLQRDERARYRPKS